MPQLNAQIHIENLRLRTYIGFNETEKQNKQDVVINAWVDYCAGEASQSDDIDKAVNYRTLCKKIIHHVENNRFLLLEKLTSEVLSLCANANNVTAAKVTISKPHALRFADSVSLTLSTQRDA
ncbi:dihydroneopterin triphosphate 2'-epimerase [Marinomonas sp. NPDC078689]|uniref:dihydroneopterin triphosphate 2'-epimerase n=1 Tax=Marinomonas sp. NPDC078689 TaxID=3364147 RepID=UPI0037C5F378